jgi:hypothetical protein
MAKTPEFRGEPLAELGKFSAVGQKLVRKLSAASQGFCVCPHGLERFVRNFRRSIYSGDIEAAKRLYVRLLGYGFTAQRFEQGIKASEPLAELSAKDGSQKAFIDGLSPYDRRMFDKARAYETRLSSLKVDARRLFPMEIKGIPTATGKVIRMYQDSPRDDLLGQGMRK